MNDQQKAKAQYGPGIIANLTPTLAAYETYDGIKIGVYEHAIYSDFGIYIEGPDGETWADRPFALSSESYGWKPADRFADWDEAESAASGGDNDAFEPWDANDWLTCLEDEADTLLEAFCADCIE